MFAENKPVFAGVSVFSVFSCLLCFEQNQIFLDLSANFMWSSGLSPVTNVGADCWQCFNPFSIYPGTVSGSTMRSHSVYPAAVTLLQMPSTSTRWYRYI